jgi:hypothetical protein
VGDGAFPVSLIQELDKKQRKFARVQIDIDGMDPLH